VLFLSFSDLLYHDGSIYHAVTPVQSFWLVLYLSGVLLLLVARVTPSWSYHKPAISRIDVFQCVDQHIRIMFKFLRYGGDVMKTKQASEKKASGETKQGYQEMMEARLHEWQAKIDVLKSKAEKVKAEQKLKYQEEIQNLQGKQRQLREKLDELKTSGESAWQEMKTGVEMAWKDLEAGIKRSMDRFK